MIFFFKKVSLSRNLTESKVDPMAGNDLYLFYFNQTCDTSDVTCSPTRCSFGGGGSVGAVFHFFFIFDFRDCLLD